MTINKPLTIIAGVKKILTYVFIHTLIVQFPSNWEIIKKYIAIVNICILKSNVDIFFYT